MTKKEKDGWVVGSGAVGRREKELGIVGLQQRRERLRRLLGKKKEERKR